MTIRLELHFKISTETTLQEIRLELAKEDANEAAQGISPPHKTSLTTFLTKGFDLEEQQLVSFFFITY